MPSLASPGCGSCSHPTHFAASHATVGPARSARRSGGLCNYVQLVYAQGVPLATILASVPASEAETQAALADMGAVEVDGACLLAHEPISVPTLVCPRPSRQADGSRCLPT